MARITIEIDSHDPEDQKMLRALCSPIISFDDLEVSYDNDGIAVVQPKVSATQDAEPGEKSRRPRRTRAQIEADAAAALALAEGPTAPAQTAASSASESEASDPFTQEEKSLPTSSGSPVSPLTVQDIRAALKKHMETEGKDGSTARAIFKGFKSAAESSRGQPAVSAGEIDPADYTEVHALLLAV